MRILLALVGSAIIGVYAVVGALMMNDWAVVAASGLPLDQTIAAMTAADQPYDTTMGIAFAVAGVVLAVAWAVFALVPRVPLWVAVGSGAALVALGAIPYTLASFGNLNSVGDTFFDWNAAAAARLELPLYAASGVAFVVAVVVTTVGATVTVRRERRRLAAGSADRNGSNGS